MAVTDNDNDEGGKSPDEKNPGKDFMDAKNLTEKEDLKKNVDVDVEKNNLDSCFPEKRDLSRYSSGFTDPDSGCAKSDASSTSENDSKSTDQKEDGDGEGEGKDVEAGEMPVEEEEMLEDAPVDWSIVACSVIFGLGLATVLLYFSIRNLIRAQQLAGEFQENWVKQNEGKGRGKRSLGDGGEDEPDFPFDEDGYMSRMRDPMRFMDEEDLMDMPPMVRERYARMGPEERYRMNLWMRKMRMMRRHGFEGDLDEDEMMDGMDDPPDWAGMDAWDGWDGWGPPPWNVTDDDAAVNGTDDGGTETPASTTASSAAAEDSTVPSAVSSTVDYSAEESGTVESPTVKSPATESVTLESDTMSSATVDSVSMETISMEPTVESTSTSVEGTTVP